MTLINQERVDISSGSTDFVIALRAHNDELSDQRKREYWAMAGGLQAIANGDGQSADQLRQVAAATLQYLGMKECVICHKLTSSRADPPVCSAICRDIQAALTNGGG